MTVHRPLYWTSGSDLRQMADADLDVVSYYIRKRYAWYLDNNANIPGDVRNAQSNVDWQSIGSITNTVRSSGTATNTDDNDPSGPDDEDFSGSWGSTDTTSSSTSSITMYQYTNHNVAYQTAATINATGMLYWSDPDLKIGPTDEADLLDTIVTDALTQARTGDEVGSYRIATSTPAGGTWSDKGTIFTDTIYGDGSYGVYKLYLKTANTTDPTTSNNMVKWDSSTGSIKLVDSDDYSLDFIDSIWMNAMRRNHLMYSIVNPFDPLSEYTQRGTIYDKKYQSTSSMISLGGGTYTRTDWPSGTIINATGPYDFVITGTRTP